MGLTTLPPSCPYCLKIWEPQPPGILKACPGRYGIALPLPFYQTASHHMPQDV
jgi:hypothetical protein